MNPTVDRLLARSRAALAKTPLPRFFAWWGRELFACLPPRWRAFLAGRAETLLLGASGEGLVVWRESGGEIHEYGRIDRELPAEEQAAQLRRLREGIEDPAVRMVYCIDGERVLSRVLSLPAAATDDLRKVLAFEMDRQTPFKADQVYFDSRIAGHDAQGRSARVELVLIPRGRLDAELASLPGGLAQLDGVDAWQGGAGVMRRHVNLLPVDKRMRRRDLRLPLNLGLAAAALVLLVLNMDESLANRSVALDAMRSEVDAAAKEAKQVAALRKSLADSIEGANFLVERKRSGAMVVALINDITQRLPLDTYLERLQIENKQVQLQGQAAEAAKLIALLGASPCLGNPGFQGQVQPDPRTGKERFQINAELKQCSPQPDAAPAPAPAPAATVAVAKPGDQVKSAPESGKPEAAKPASPAPAAGKASPARSDARTAQPRQRSRTDKKEP